MPGWHAPAVTGEGALESAYAVTDLAAAAIGAAAMALAAYIAECTGRAPAVSVDRRLSSLWFGRSLRPIGWRVPPVRDPVTGDYQGQDGWIRIHANAPHHRRHALHVLGAASRRDSVARAVAQRRVRDLEADLVAAGACAACMRTRAQWAAHPQGRAVAQTPLFLTEEGDCGTRASRAGHDAGRPLSGYASWT